MCVARAGVCREGGTAETPPVCGGLGWGVVRATGGPVDELGSGDEWHKVPHGDRASRGKPMEKCSAPRSASGSRGCASAPCPPQVNLVRRAPPGRRAGRAEDGAFPGMICHWFRRKGDGDLVSEQQQQQLQSNRAGLPFT